MQLMHMADATAVRHMTALLHEIHLEWYESYQCRNNIAGKGISYDLHPLNSKILEDPLSLSWSLLPRSQGRFPSSEQSIISLNADNIFPFWLSTLFIFRL
jgi:hypothetical protein